MSRNITSYRDVVNVVASQEPNSVGTVLQTAGKIGALALEQNQEARLTESLSAAQLELNKLDNQFRTNSQSDPFNEKAIGEYRRNRQKIFDTYGSNINPLYKNKWVGITNELSAKTDLSNQEWGFKQTQINTKESMLKSINNYLSQAQIDGEKFGASDVSEIESFYNYQAAKNQLDGFGNKYLGETTTAKITSDFEQDWAKVFISGVAKSNPVKALTLINNEQVRDTISNPADYEQLRSAIENKAINFQETAIKQEILGKLKSENVMFSEGGVFSYAELAQVTNGMSEPAKEYFLQVNGFKDSTGKKKEKITADQKLAIDGDIINSIAAIASDENIDNNKVVALQNSIYSAMSSGALTKDEGARYISELLQPVISEQESKLEEYSAFNWNPFKDNYGLDTLQNVFSDTIERKPPEGRETISPEEMAINTKNKVNFYNNYLLSLRSQVDKYVSPEFPKGISLENISQVPSKDRKAMFEKASQMAISDFKINKITETRVKSGIDVAIPEQAIRVLLDNPELAADFDKKYGVGSANRMLNR
jgi:hypothetical protein